MFEAHRLCVSLNSRLESNKEEQSKEVHLGAFSIREDSPVDRRRDSQGEDATKAVPHPFPPVWTPHIKDYP